ncbi:Endo-1,3(4)-beta-glucanase 1 [Talaromyces islandicus]|uniref:glucan endo-1,3-beta-D-glucosidase n=1 Tax=Talaromyces islandicus TaxID=28573 RepID=A0A0U1M651_TALIS|nr:Endo-1,3(4)-beta-glucanase 1 [Talaromyces islandicus]
MLQSLVLFLASAAFGSGSSHISHKRSLLGPIGTGSPQTIAGGTVECGAPPVTSFFDGLKPPFPTNSWWAPYAAPPGNATAAGPFPYESALYGDGVVFGISAKRQFDGTSIHQPTQTDWRAIFAEHSGEFANHKATAFDTQSVTVQYVQGSAAMTFYAVPGSPYVTFHYNDSTPLLTAMNGGIKSFNNQTLSVGANATATGTEFSVTDTSNSTYLIYALSPITLTATSNSTNLGTVSASSPFTGVLRLAMLNETAHKELLDQYHGVYPISVGLDYSWTNSTGSLVFSWDTAGNGTDLLMLTWPHHRIAMQNPNYPATTALSYLTTKGYMYPALGNQWELQYNLTSSLWDPPRALDKSCSSSVIKGLEYEVGQLNISNAPVPGDFYFWGGTLNSVARLAAIADNLGRSDLIQPVVQYLEASFEHWFDSSATTLAAFETTWGGVVDKAGATDANIDFGNGFYNDHHFHYGYFLSVAATIAKYDTTWLNKHKDYINWFARDIINPSSEDPYFPITRCRDWFAGHSWASGIANGAGSRDQESTGEAVNGYYGAALWASVALSNDYLNFARLLLATEMHGAQVYWHLYPSLSPTDPNNPYPEQGVRELITVGNVEDWQSGAWLFWGDQKSEIAAIQMLPVTPANEVLYDTEWVENVWSYAMDELIDPSIGDSWKCVMVAAYSNANPQVAAQWSANMTSWGTGQTYTNELYFIGTRPNPSGTPICGVVPQNPYGVFQIQEVSSGNYVTASSADTNLTVSANNGTAVTFNSTFVPNAGTLQLTSTSQYVTADGSGNYTLAASRATASSWERFVVRQKVGAASGVYSIKAASNGFYVTVNGDGWLINNAANETDSAGFYFHST